MTIIGYMTAENEQDAEIFAHFFVKQYHSSHSMEYTVIINVQFKKSQSECAVQFFHTKMKAPSLVNSHVFINTFRRTIISLKEIQIFGQVV